MINTITRHLIAVFAAAFCVFSSSAIAQSQSAETSDNTNVVNSTLAVKDAEQSVVRIVVVGKTLYDEYIVVSSGSGVVVAPQKVLTNFHVVDTSDGDGMITQYFYAVVPSLASQDEAKQGIVTATWPTGDMALLQVDDLKMPPIAINTTMQKNDLVEAMGYPGITDRLQGKSAGDLIQPAEVYVSHGNIAVFSSRNPNGEYSDTIFHTADINPGNSGGPLVNTCGQVIGINTWSAKATADEDGITVNSGQFIATRANEIVHFLQSNSVSPNIIDSECISKTSAELKTEADFAAQLKAQQLVADQQRQQESRNTRTTLLILITALVIMGAGFTGVLVYMARRQGRSFPVKPFVTPASEGETESIPKEPAPPSEKGSADAPLSSAPGAPPPAWMVWLYANKALAIGGGTFVFICLGIVFLWPHKSVNTAPSAPLVASLICTPVPAESFSNDKLEGTDFVFEPGRQCVNGRTPYLKTSSGDYVRYLINTKAGHISRMTLSSNLKNFTREDFMLTDEHADSYKARLEGMGTLNCAAQEDGAVNIQLQTLNDLAASIIGPTPYQKVRWQCVQR